MAFVPAFIFLYVASLSAESGYNLWLRYVQVSDAGLLAQYRANATQTVVQGASATMLAADSELIGGLNGLLAQTTPNQTSVTANGAIVVGTPSNSSIIGGLGLTFDANPEAYQIISTTSGGYSIIAVASSGDIGALYGTYGLLRLIQTGKTLTDLNIVDKPLIKKRMLDHWDDTTGVNRGYGGNSIWNWGQLPGTISPRYKMYARACASIGINCVNLNDVNAVVSFMKGNMIAKEAVLANVFRPYGIRLFISPPWNAPTTSGMGTLTTADPTNASVISWWTNKIDSIYMAIPDFGGFLEKADAEGTSGPLQYGRTEAQGANLFANALAPHGGVVFWRAFWYQDTMSSDRLKASYNMFHPLDGQFAPNVILQAKNGPFDFQPREPVHTLFGSMPSTNIGMECEITTEYLGQAHYLVYLGPYWKEYLEFDTYAKGAGSTVAKVIDGSLFGDTLTGMGGVPGIGTDSNWCGNDMAQANWYAFGRLAWNHELSSDSIANEWVKMTWSWNPTVISTICAMMAGSREAVVKFQEPLGMGYLCGSDHYSPAPGTVQNASYPSYNPTYWHKADAVGLGYDRESASPGSDFVDEYFSPNNTMYNTLSTTPDNLLCYYHHVPWNYVVPSTGRTLWNELCFRYYDGTHYVGVEDSTQWPTLIGLIDAQRYAVQKTLLDGNYSAAVNWRNTCVTYFATFSKQAIPPYTPTAVHPPLPQRMPSLKYGMVKIYDLRGKLVTSSLLSGNPSTWQGALRQTLRPGTYIVKSAGYQPIKVMVGSDR